MRRRNSGRNVGIEQAVGRGRGFEVVTLGVEVKDTDGKEKRRALSYGGHVTRGKACGNRRGSEYGKAATS